MLVLFAVGCIEAPGCIEIRRNFPNSSFKGSDGLQIGRILDVKIEVGKREAILVAPLSAPTKLFDSDGLFSLLFPLLASDHREISQYVSQSCEPMHWLSYEMFIECIRPYVESLVEDMKMRVKIRDIVRDAAFSKLRRAETRRFDRLRKQVINLLRYVVGFVDHKFLRDNLSILDLVKSFIHGLSNCLLQKLLFF
jgi:hypothetical protein